MRHRAACNVSASHFFTWSQLLLFAIDVCSFLIMIRLQAVRNIRVPTSDALPFNGAHARVECDILPESQVYTDDGSPMFSPGLMLITSFSASTCPSPWPSPLSHGHYSNCSGSTFSASCVEIDPPRPRREMRRLEWCCRGLPPPISCPRCSPPRPPSPHSSLASCFDTTCRRDVK